MKLSAIVAWYTGPNEGCQRVNYLWDHDFCANFLNFCADRNLSAKPLQNDLSTTGASVTRRRTAHVKQPPVRVKPVGLRLS